MMIRPCKKPLHPRFYQWCPLCQIHFTYLWEDTDPSCTAPVVKCPFCYTPYYADLQPYPGSDEPTYEILTLTENGWEKQGPVERVQTFAAISNGGR